MTGVQTCALPIFLTDYDESRAKRVVELESMVDRYEDELGAYLVKLSSRNLSTKESHAVTKILHCIGDFERISDHALNLMDAAKEMHEKRLSFSGKATEELAVFTRAIKDIVNITIEVFETEDVRKATSVEPLEEVIDNLNQKIKNRHVKRLQNGECTIELGFILSDICTNYERVSDHCSNIAVCIIQMQTDGLGAHGYLDNVKSENNEEFRNEYQEDKKHYVLPEQ